MGELQIADVRSQVALSLFTDFENFSTFKPQALHEKSLKSMLDQLHRLERRDEDRSRQVKIGVRPRFSLKRWAWKSGHGPDFSLQASNRGNSTLFSRWMCSCTSSISFCTPA